MNRAGKPVYVVYQELDPARKLGKVYLPGGGDDAYLLNTGSAPLDIERKCCRSPGEWDRVTSPLIACEIKNRSRLNSSAQAWGCALSYTSINCRMLACVYRCVVESDTCPSSS